MYYSTSRALAVLELLQTYGLMRGTLLHGFAKNLAPLAYMLAGLDCPIEIIEPPELRTAMLELASRIRTKAL